jgi:hypothetical protein
MLSFEHHDDDSCYTDDDTEHGKERTHLVVRHSVDADLKKIEYVHLNFSRYIVITFSRYMTIVQRVAGSAWAG